MKKEIVDNVTRKSGVAEVCDHIVVIAFTLINIFNGQNGVLPLSHKHSCKMPLYLKLFRDVPLF